MDGEFLKTHAVVQVFWTCVCVTCVIVVCRWRPSSLTAKRIASLVFATHPYTQAHTTQHRRQGCHDNRPSAQKQHVLGGSTQLLKKKQEVVFAASL